LRLLFDQNLSPKLVNWLADLYPGSSHVALLGLDRASDQAIWEYALDHGYVIVTKDADYDDMSVVRGHPPKVLWLLIGNCTTAQVENVLRQNHALVEEFEQDPAMRTLCLR
jgi:predicted nuclease of predicted toxin-antitoxin system